MSEQQAPLFRRGSEQAQEAAATSGASFARIRYFKLDATPPGNVGIVRFIEDADTWIVTDQYQFLPTKPKPDGWEGNWPARLSAVSRQDPALKDLFDTDFIRDHMRKPDGKPYRPSPRTWTVGCMREEVIENGKRIGFRDKTREIIVKDNDGTETKGTEKDIVVFSMGYKNFYSNLAGCYRAYGTLLDRDYMIIRSGSDKDTTYQIAPLDPIPDFDLRDPKWADRYPRDWKLEEVIFEQASDEFYGRFFDPSYTDTSRTDTASGNGASVAQQAKPDENEARMREIAERVKGGSGVQSYTPTEEQATPAPSGPRNLD